MRRRAKKAKQEAKAPALLSSPLPPVTADRAYDSCVAAISIIAVAGRSLEQQEVTQEPAALQAAVRELWTVHDYLFPLREDADAEDAP